MFDAEKHEAGESMKVALVVPRLTADSAVNLDIIEQMAADAVSSEASLVLLPEAVLTGLINNDDPAHDIQLGQTIPGTATDRLGTFCLRQGCWLGFGMLERKETSLYDSAVLLKSDGSIALTYRRNQPQWHGKKVYPDIYCEGTDIPTAQTPFGTMAFLLCGDLFDDAVVSSFQNLSADWMLFPFARCFSDGTADQNRWDTEELPEYARRVRMAQTPALMVNYLTDSSLPDDNSFGGAFVVSAEGEVLASHPLGEDGMLIVEMKTTSNKRLNATR